MSYGDEVDAQVERNDGRGGWDQGPLAIVQEAAEEAVDVAAWLRGLDQYPMTAGQLDRIERVIGDSRLIWEELRELAQTYRVKPAGESTPKSKTTMLDEEAESLGRSLDSGGQHA